MIKKIIKKIFTEVMPLSELHKNSYSQYGEDQIINSLIYLLQIKDVNFIDIGANHPYKLNNTVLLSLSGFNGINIEPDIKNFELLNKFRKNDLNLNIGVSSEITTLTYYKFNDSVYNTFSYEEYTKLSSKQEVIFVEEVNVEVSTYNQIVSRYLMGTPPTILFIDTEGLDRIILESIDFEAYSPKILVVETFAYGTFEKDQTLIEFIKTRGYSVHADTFVNTIFVKKTLLPFVKR